MATFDDIARMRAQLMAEKRGRMARHPQQVAGAVNQGADALARMAQYLQQKQIAADRITAAGARADADRKQRMQIEQAKARQKAQLEAAKIDAANQRAAAERERKNFASDMDNRQELIGGGALEDHLGELHGLGLTPDEADDFAKKQLGYGSDDYREMDEANEARNRAEEGRMRDDEKHRADLDKARQDTATSRAREDKIRHDMKPGRGGANRSKDRGRYTSVKPGDKWTGRGFSPGGLGGTTSPLSDARNQKAAITREVKSYPFNEKASFIKKYDEAFDLLGKVDTSSWRVKWNEATQDFLGVQDPNLAELTGILAELRDAPSRDKSGAVIGVEEQRSLAKIFGGEYLDEQTLRRLLSRARSWAVREDYSMRQQAALGNLVLPDAPYDPRAFSGNIRLGH